MKQNIAIIKYIFLKNKPEEINDGKRKIYESSYKKELVSNNEEVFLNELGFINDSQADKLNHGGSEQAICVYPQKYYDFFEMKYNLELSICAFGENLTIDNLDDSDFCIGDKYKCGEVVFEVSQPRLPCWKISSVNGIKNLTFLVVKEFKSGFYMRVIKSGKISRNDSLELIERKYPKLNIEFLNKCAFDVTNNQNNIKEILECAKLGKAFSEHLSNKLSKINNKL